MPKSKRPDASQPAVLYMESPMFRKARAYCEANHDEWYILSAKHGHTHSFPRNCLRYDCPMHRKHAIRSRAAGSADGAGVAPQLESLRKWLDYYRDEHQRFHHLVFSPPNDIAVHAHDPMKRLVEACRDVMDELGVQGSVVYHPWRQEKEDWEDDSMGQWPDVINSNSPWEVIKEDLEYAHHFHVIGVAHEALDYSITEEIEAETGWVFHRIENEQDNSVSIADTPAMCRAVLYAMSHAGVYDTPEQRRLAAWMKGPDVPHCQVFTETAIEVEHLVNQAAIKSLGITPTDLTCDEEVPPDEVHLGFDEGLPDFLRASEQRAHPATGEAAPLSAAAGPTVDGKHRGHDVYLPGGPGGGPTTGELDPPGRRDDWAFDDTGSSSSSSSTTSSSSSGSSSSGDEDVERADVCGARLLHISQASEYLLSRPEWRQRIDDQERLDHLDRLYRQYVSWLEHKDLPPIEARPMVTEERHGPGEISDRRPPPEPDPPPD